MKRTLAAAVLAVAASAPAWLAAVPADAGPLPPPTVDVGIIKIVPEWTYSGHGKLAVITRCGHRGDLRVVSSDMLRRPVNLPRRGDLLIRVAGATKAGKYPIALWCVARSGQVDAMDLGSVKIRKWLKGFRLPPPPGLPPGFRPGLTVSTR
jgi:hypothetical protein